MTDAWQSLLLWCGDSQDRKLSNFTTTSQFNLHQTHCRFCSGLCFDSRLHWLRRNMSGRIWGSQQHTAPRLYTQRRGTACRHTTTQIHTHDTLAVTTCLWRLSN